MVDSGIVGFSDYAVEFEIGETSFEGLEGVFRDFRSVFALYSSFKSVLYMVICLSTFEKSMSSSCAGPPAIWIFYKVKLR